MTSYLLPIADCEPLAWIVGEQRTAFGEHRRRQAEALEVGDTLFLYTTLTCQIDLNKREIGGGSSRGRPCAGLSHRRLSAAG